MNLRRLQLAIITLSIGACDGNGYGNATSPTVEAMKTLPSNDEILAAVYDNIYTVPAGFYVDARADTPRSYALYHVKDVSVSFELCSDDYAEARAWEEADNHTRAVNGYYVGSVETDNYFEFIRELSFPDDVGNVPGITSPGFARVFKCSSINRDGVDRNLRNGYGGTLNQTQLSADTVREFAEYLWQFTFFDTSRAKVLDSFSSERADAHEHTLLLGFAINQGIGVCDRIEVIDWVFRADKASGEVVRNFRVLFAIEAQLVDGFPEQCG